MIVANCHGSKAVGVQPAKNGGITLTTKKVKNLNSPLLNKNEVTWGANKSGPKLVLLAIHTLACSFITFEQVLSQAHRIYKGIAGHTAKKGYRADLREAAVARASAIRLSQRPKKDLPDKKPRGLKAKATAK